MKTTVLLILLFTSVLSPAAPVRLLKRQENSSCRYIAYRETETQAILGTRHVSAMAFPWVVQPVGHSGRGSLKIIPAVAPQKEEAATLHTWPFTMALYHVPVVEFALFILSLI